jgi:hypothetical protein
MKRQPEYELQVAVCDYLRAAYPKVVFRSETTSCVKLNVRQAVRIKKLQRDGFAWPDLFIAEPRAKYAGLWIELKAASPYLKNGSLSSNEHIQAQARAGLMLEMRGFQFAFIWSFDMAKHCIDLYLKQ